MRGRGRIRIADKGRSETDVERSGLYETGFLFVGEVVEFFLDEDGRPRVAPIGFRTIIPALEQADNLIDEKQYPQAQALLSEVRQLIQTAELHPDRHELLTIRLETIEQGISTPEGDLRKLLGAIESQLRFWREDVGYQREIANELTTAGRIFEGLKQHPNLEEILESLTVDFLLRSLGTAAKPKPAD